MAGRGVERGGRRGAATARTPERARRARPASEPAPRRPARQKGDRGKRRRLNLPFGISTTRRAAILATVVGALALSVAVPTRTYLSQRTGVEIQQQRQAELRRQVDELEHRKAQLADPEQIKAEARRRLRYVMPGETPYMVELPSDAGGPGAHQPPTHPIPQQSWYQVLWDSVTGAAR